MSAVVQAKPAMVESADSALIEFESRGRWPLCLAGAVLIAVKARR
jgi:hypothetical protein